MSVPVRALLIEDNEDDALLVVRSLQRAGLAPQPHRVDSAAAVRDALAHGPWDIIISDFNMPGFTGTDALKLVRERDHETPFIFVSGTIGEDVAVEAMRAGAQDYIIKGNLKRLIPAVERELRDSKTRRARERQQAAIARLGRGSLEMSDLHDLFALAASLLAETLELEFSAIFELLSDGVTLQLAAGHGWMSGSGGRTCELGPTSQAGHALQRAESVVVEDLAQETRFRDASFVGNHGATSGVTVVIPGHQQAFGILAAYGTKPQRFTPEEVRFVEAMAHVLGVVIERDRTDQALRQAQRLESVGRLAGGVAHDFNNLLTVMMAHSELLMAELPPGEPLQESASEIRTATQRASALTRQLLAFSRRQVLEARTFSVNDVVSGLEKMLGRLVRDDIALELDLAPDVAAVRADPGKLEQVVVNLVVNARDAMPEGGTLRIETRNVERAEPAVRSDESLEAGRYVLLAVTDTGIGMDRETLSRIFEPFFTTKGPEHGTGLGLATVHGIVKQSGGGIEAHSEPGRGTTFEIFLPAVSGAPEPLLPPPPAAPAATGQETILLAEDEASLRRAVTRMLSDAGYAVLAAADGDEALRMLAGHDGEVHLLLSDIRLPGMRGGELARRALAERPGLRVLHMSGYTAPELMAKDDLLESSAFLQKPFTREELTERVREVLDAGERRETL